MSRRLYTSRDELGPCQIVAPYRTWHAAVRRIRARWS
jgi:hypothetical protein